MKLNSAQTKRLVKVLYDDEVTQNALFAVFLEDVPVYRAEQLFNQKHNTLKSKVNKVKKNAALIETVMDIK
ncbi:TPA: hypothetical protein N2891_002452 [Vibrio parahaemolyticus]|uniref:hypothetical protein n=1 Tax=Vibrio parahaemolyticus TaxID=670 RepID=UPI000939F89D|nr:hypothetical protein [Vibrio parahaemolyticus]HCG9691580.1 hypothetical protein [Vibrio parahaemolyticus]HCH1089159.1 hypothetical protein [Vibrio parahaemolyticus]HCH1586856.1 hypothetical protein [Vibrio parahaemolyticus]HCH6248242.1 hypothetical protein [Vibrio parahaemolyticus]HCM0673774.1 hypothetical protein [Vibrio parahaemolyticus]